MASRNLREGILWYVVFAAAGARPPPLTKHGARARVRVRSVVIRHVHISYAGPVEATTCRATLARTMLDDRSSPGPSPRNRNSASSDSHSSYTLTRSDSIGSAATTKSRQPLVCRACATAAAERVKKFCLVRGRT